MKMLMTIFENSLGEVTHQEFYPLDNYVAQVKSGPVLALKGKNVASVTVVHNDGSSVEYRKIDQQDIPCKCPPGEKVRV